MKLPIGIQSFKKIRSEDYVYVDKTKEAYELITKYEYAFLSRPRRFGKSLFLDTLRHIFEGNRELFKGLWIYDKWEFEEYPVIKISWAGDFKTLESTNQVAVRIFEINQKNLGIDCKPSDNASVCFNRLIQEAYKKYNKKVVILIDEYDKPILDNLDNLKRAEENRDFLRGLYIQIKDNDEFIKFAFLTGITKFSKASIFSGLNNIEDISLNPDFGNICGYTQEELESNFKEFLDGVDLDRVKLWYNGYNFLKDKIYNPFDILKYFREKKFKSYWFESGSPYHLITLLKNHNFYLPELENVVVDETIVDTFDIEKIRVESLLFQAGYLTIDEAIEMPYGVEYKLKVPNLEVQVSLNKLILDYLGGEDFSKERGEAYRALVSGDLEKFRDILNSLFASISYTNYTRNEIKRFEGFYASVVYAFLASIGVELIAEDVTNRGRIDLTVKVDSKIYIIEFKVMENGQWKMDNEGVAEKSEDFSADKECGALNQIKEKKYYEKYLNEGEVYLVGICFSDGEIKKFNWELQKM